MRFKFFILFFTLLGCNKQTFHLTEIVGHAGNGLDIPISFYAPNTLESIELALGTPGVAGVEIDLHLSADNEFWLNHDNLLEAETNHSGCISELSFEDLKNVRYKTINQEKLVRLRDLNFNLYTDKKIYLDIRHYNGCTEQLIQQQAIIESLEPIIHQWANVHFIVVTNHKEWLNAFALKNWEVYCDIETMTEFEQLKNGNYIYHGIIIRNSACTKEDVSRIKNENKKVILFDLRAPKSIRMALKKQADGIMTDDVKAALIEKN